MRQGARQNDLAENRHAARAGRTGHFDQFTVAVQNSGVGVDEDGHYGAQKNHEKFGFVTQSQENNDQGQEGDARHRA